MRWLVLLLVITGCSTVKHQAIMPPKKVLPIVMSKPKAATSFVVAWDACGQDSNVWFRIYKHTDNFHTRTLYAQVTNALSCNIAVNDEFGFFTVVSTDGVTEVNSVRQCQ